MPDMGDVLNYAKPEDIKVAAAALLGVSEVHHRREEAFDDVFYFLNLIPEFKHYFKNFIDVLNNPIRREPELLTHGQGQMMKGNIRHCGTYVFFPLIVVSWFVCVLLMNCIPFRSRTPIRKERPPSWSLLHVDPGDRRGRV